MSKGGDGVDSRVVSVQAFNMSQRSMGQRRRHRSLFGRTKARKWVVVALAIAAVAAISALLAIAASDGTAPGQSSELPVDGAPDD